MSGNGNGVNFWRWVAAVLCTLLIGVVAYGFGDISNDIDQIQGGIENQRAVSQAHALRIQKNDLRFEELKRIMEEVRDDVKDIKAEQ